jgi:hypothetical protein
VHDLRRQAGDLAEDLQLTKTATSEAAATGASDEDCKTVQQQRTMYVVWEVIQHSNWDNSLKILQQGRGREAPGDIINSDREKRLRTPGPV